MAEGNKSVKEVNDTMVKFLPELALDYAKYPMKQDWWYLLSKKGLKGEALFLKEENKGVKMDYVFGRAMGGPGYYSLLTKTYYINVCSRITYECPVAFCAMSKKAHKACDEWDHDVKCIIHAWQLATKPDDQVATNDAQAEAHMTYFGGPCLCNKMILK
jgi:hypothetical protein